MAIQMRRGANSDFIPSKMLPGEIAVTTDGTRKVYAAFQANDVKELASKEDVQGLINGFTSVVDREIAEAEQRIESKGQQVLETIPDLYEEVSARADEAVRSKADAIVCSVSGVNTIAKDSSNDYLRNLKLYGKNTQGDNPSLSNPQPLESNGKLGDSGQKEVESWVYGKNLLPYPYLKESATLGGITITVNNDGSVTLNGTANKTVYFELTTMQFEVGESYVINGGYKTDVRIKADGHNVNAYGTETAFVATKESDKIYIIIDIGKTVSNVIVYPMIRKAEITDGTYEPYTKQSHISLVGDGLKGNPLGTTIPDVIANRKIHMDGVYWDVETEQYYIGDTKNNAESIGMQRIEQIVLDGVSEGRKFKSFDSSYPSCSGGLLKPALIRQMMCTHFVFNDNYTDDEFAYITANGGAFVIGKTPDFTSVEDGNNWLAEQYANGTPVTIQYILKEPIETPLTADEIASYKALHSNYKVTSVMNDCGAFMEVTYNADMETWINNAIDSRITKTLAQYKEE